MRVAAVQLNIGTSKDRNLERALRLVREAAARGAQLIALPEWLTYTGPASGYAAVAEPLPGPTSALMVAAAHEHGVAIHGGSLFERLPEAADARLSNTSYVVDGSGRLVTYRKVHLFDVAVGDDVTQRESACIEPGDELVTVRLGDATLGLSICYDLRFPEVYRALALAGANVMVVPSAFAEATGRAHWEVLLRARAIENGAYVVAPAQHGRGASYPMYGHSMIVDPWGVVLDELPAGDGLVMADVDAAEATRRRRQIPALENRRPAVYGRPVRAAHLAFS